jgi:secreted Zn-dependent insulinase-like peptidase
MEPIKSKSDKRDYKVITLPNELEVLLIHDPAVDKVFNLSIN